MYENARDFSVEEDVEKLFSSAFAHVFVVISDQITPCLSDMYEIKPSFQVSDWF